MRQRQDRQERLPQGSHQRLTRRLASSSLGLVGSATLPQRSGVLTVGRTRSSFPCPHRRLSTTLRRFPCCPFGAQSSFPARPSPSRSDGQRPLLWRSTSSARTSPTSRSSRSARHKIDDPGQADLYEYGTLARVVGIDKQSKGTYAVVLEGVARVRLASVETSTPFLEAKVEPIDHSGWPHDDELEALGMSLRDATRDLIDLLPGIPASSSPGSRPFRRQPTLPTSSRPTSRRRSRRRSRSSRRPSRRRASARC